MSQGNPRPDPVPAPTPGLKRRFLRVFRLLALLSIVVAAVAVLIVARGDPTVHVHMLIATALGVGLTMLLGSGLMALLFLSSSSGYDDAASPRVHEENDEE